MNVANHWSVSVHPRQPDRLPVNHGLSSGKSPGARRRLALAAAAFLIMDSGVIMAQPRGQSTGPEQAVRDTLTAFAEDWNQNNEQALLGYWLPDGRYVDAAGSVFSVEAFIRQAEQDLPAGDQRPKLSIQVESVRLPDSDVALVDGRTALTNESDQLLRESRFSATLVLHDGAWRIAQVHQLSVRSEMQSEPLEALAWLIGEWTGRQHDTQISTTVTWTEGGKFISRQFEVHREGKLILTGSQKIGWDPRTRQIKSWFFDSEGTIGEGSWERHDEHWLVTVTGTMRDGQNISNTNGYTPIDDNTFLRRSTHVSIGNHKMADNEAVFMRVEPRTSGVD